MEALCELYETITLRAARAYHASRPLSEVRKELRAVAAAKTSEIVAPLKGLIPDEEIGDLKAGLVQGADEAAVEAYDVLAARELFPIRSTDPARFAAENYAACLKSIDGKDEDEDQ